MDPKSLLDFVLHVDDKLMQLTQQFGPQIYALLFLIIFAETGLVVAPFLPGDSLLFAAGTLAARAESGLNVVTLSVVLFIAAVLGDTVNYHIGKAFGHKLFANPNSKVFKKEYLDKTHAFYDKHGAKTIVLCRFAPIVRTFAPFVAGMGAMNYRTFFLYNVVGAFAWVLICVGGGYAFGNIPLVSKNFEKVVVLIVVLSIVPMFFEIWKHRKDHPATAKDLEGAADAAAHSAEA